ncbi:hypothetical protein H920_17387 [Fukomys damarensis]|uniref:Uncharacterized protein n=1 Tax=Fukomys damarensis TaxID=885580 RepID=A0A091CUD4_FUKDA|nr:hypothetical protein H920_17387 [Fukomys damarensis]
MGLEEEKKGAPPPAKTGAVIQSGKEKGLWGSQGDPAAAQMFPLIPADAVPLGQIDLNSHEAARRHLSAPIGAAEISLGK